MILNEEVFDILNFDVPDVANADIEVTDMDTTVPEAGPKVGVETLLMQSIKDVYGMIEGYNSLSIALTDIGNEPAAISVADIIKMEHANIGILQDILAEISPNAEAVDINESLNEGIRGINLKDYDDGYVEMRDGVPQFVYDNLRDARNGIIWSIRGDHEFGDKDHSYEIKQWKNGELLDLDESLNEDMTPEKKRMIILTMCSYINEALKSLAKENIKFDEKTFVEVIKACMPNLKRSLKESLNENLENIDIPKDILLFTNMDTDSFKKLELDEKYGIIKNAFYCFKKDYDEIKSIEDDFNYIDDIYRLRKIFYNKYIDFAKKCSEYLKNRDSISGYGKYDILKIKIEDICKKVDNNFPYGWK